MPISNLTTISGTPFLRFLSTSGDGNVANSVATGDYSGAATDFYFQPGATQVFRIGMTQFTVSDNATFNQGDYAGIAAGLTNGVKLFQRINSVETQLIGGFTIKTNKDFFAASPDVELSTFAGTAQTISIAFKTFADSNAYLTLDGRTSDRIIVRLNDNFTSLVDQRFIIRGNRL